MFEDLINEINNNSIITSILKSLPFKQYRIIRRNNKKKKVLYYGNEQMAFLIPPFMIYYLRRLLYDKTSI